MINGDLLVYLYFLGAISFKETIKTIQLIHEFILYMSIYTLLPYIIMKYFLLVNILIYSCDMRTKKVQSELSDIISS